MQPDCLYYHAVTAYNLQQRSTGDNLKIDHKQRLRVNDGHGHKRKLASLRSVYQYFTGLEKIPEDPAADVTDLDFNDNAIHITRKGPLPFPAPQTNGCQEH